MLALDFDPSRDEEFFSALPSRPAVCLIEPKERSAEPFFIRTQDLRRRLQRLLGPADPASKRLNLRDFAGSIRYRLTATPFEQAFVYYQQVRQLFPTRYKDLLRLRPPVVLKINLRNAYPRCYATRRIPLDPNGEPAGGIYYGPFASRKSAEAFAERALDLFKVRRCQIKIRRDPAYPGCIYSEMKMCLAPCFAGCTKEEYDVEVQRLAAFLETGGASLREELENQRNRASEELDFEKAALLHKRLDKLDDALRGQPELPRRLQDLNAVIFQRGAEEQSIAAYEVRAGRIAEPFLLSFATLAGEPRSAEQLLRQYLEPPERLIPAAPSPATIPIAPRPASGIPTAPSPASVIPPAPLLAGSEARTASPSSGPSPISVIPPAPLLAGSEARTASSPREFNAENLSASAPEPSTPDLSDHLWLLARWFYSNPREGEIFFRGNAWPYRKMMRACARLLAPAGEPQS